MPLYWFCLHNSNNTCCRCLSWCSIYCYCLLWYCTCCNCRFWFNRYFSHHSRSGRESYRTLCFGKPCELNLPFSRLSTAMGLRQRKGRQPDPTQMRRTVLPHFIPPDSRTFENAQEKNTVTCCSYSDGTFVTDA